MNTLHRKYWTVAFCLGFSTLALQSTSALAATHTGAAPAAHMELKNTSGSVVCYAYDTPASSAPVASNCPSGTYKEQLFNTSWSQIGQRNVTVGAPPPSSSGTHTGGSAAVHMELKNGSGAVVCYAYDTAASSAPVASGCPNGAFTEQLFNASWSQIGQRRVVVGASTPDSNYAPARNANPKFSKYRNRRSSQLRVSNLTDRTTRFDDGPASQQGAHGDGNFRATCQYSHFNYDDPIIYPNKPGKAHLHMYYGNTETDAYSTKNSLVNSGGSTCNGFELNRSAYWSPALLDGKGNVVLPKQIILYYKTKRVNDVQRMPQGLKLIAGNLPGRHSFNVSEDLFWSCGASGHSYNKSNRIPECNGDTINATISFPQCWDGVNLDSRDHRSHVAQVDVHQDCPASHPVRLPQLGVLLYYPGQDSVRGWKLSSDHGPNMVPGGTLHADWIGAWHDATMDRWVDNCLKKGRNCTLGQTGTNRTLKRLNGTASDDWQGPYLLPIPSK